MRNATVAEHISNTLEAMRTCEQNGRTDWRNTWARVLGVLAREYLPRGAGIDNGTTINADRSKPGRLVLDCEFHHMDGNGMYDGWTQHALTATPTFGRDVRIAVGGRDRNGIKDYLADVYQTALTAEIPDAEWTALVLRCRGEG